VPEPTAEPFLQQVQPRGDVLEPGEQGVHPGGHLGRVDDRARGQLLEPAVQADAGVAEQVAQALAGLLLAAGARVQCLAHGPVDAVDPLLERVADRGGQRVQAHLLAVHPGADLVEALVQPTEPVVQAVHPAGDALQSPGHAVEPAVELGELLGQPLGQGLHRAQHRGQRGVLGVELGDRLVQPLGEHADLGTVGQLGQPLANRADAVQCGQSGVDLVERVEDLLLFAVADLGGAHEHAAHAIEGRVRVSAHGGGELPVSRCKGGVPGQAVGPRQRSEGWRPPFGGTPFGPLLPLSEQRPPRTRVPSVGALAWMMCLYR
jgi:hypothetical protein